MGHLLELSSLFKDTLSMVPSPTLRCYCLAYDNQNWRSRSVTRRGHQAWGQSNHAEDGRIRVERTWVLPEVMGTKLTNCRATFAFNIFLMGHNTFSVKSSYVSIQFLVTQSIPANSRTFFAATRLFKQIFSIVCQKLTLTSINMPTFKIH